MSAAKKPCQPLAGISVAFGCCWIVDGKHSGSDHPNCFGDEQLGRRLASPLLLAAARLLVASTAAQTIRNVTEMSSSAVDRLSVAFGCRRTVDGEYSGSDYLKCFGDEQVGRGYETMHLMLHVRVDMLYVLRSLACRLGCRHGSISPACRCVRKMRAQRIPRAQKQKGGSIPSGFKHPQSLLPTEKITRRQEQVTPGFRIRGANEYSLRDARSPTATRLPSSRAFPRTCKEFQMRLGDRRRQHHSHH